MGCEKIFLLKQAPRVCLARMINLVVWQVLHKWFSGRLVCYVHSLTKLWGEEGHGLPNTVKLLLERSTFSK